LQFVHSLDVDGLPHSFLPSVPYTDSFVSWKRSCNFLLYLVLQWLPSPTGPKIPLHIVLSNMSKLTPSATYNVQHSSQV
jgi:hypothetical protein